MRICGARVLRPEGFTYSNLCFESAQIVTDCDARSVDLSGYLVLPGMVDMHGDGFERHIAPRRGAMRDLGQGILSCDAELAVNGVTTAVLAQFYSWEGGMRGPEFARRFCHALARVKEHALTDLHLQLRFETHMLDDYDRFENLVTSSGAGYVVFNDHLPHDALAKGKRPPRLTGQALKGGRSPEAHLALLKSMHERSPEVPEAVSRLAARLSATGTLMGSHDDRSAAARSDWRKRGVYVSEFPETREAAEAAKGAGDAIVLGAPNVVRGGSHSGNVGAADLLADGIGDVLASDYHFPALRQAIITLVSAGITDLAEGWRLVSENPARILGLNDRGRLESGLRADFVVMDPETHRIGATICAGKVSHMSGEVAARFLG